MYNLFSEEGMLFVRAGGGVENWKPTKTKIKCCAKDRQYYRIYKIMNSTIKSQLKCIKFNYNYKIII